tara:strand:+ start:65 stop:526 length:462 start_codon:yes stop_codon:yes gene_type:complete
MSYTYQTYIFSGHAYVKREDVECMLKWEKEKLEKLQEKFVALEKDRNEEVKLAKKMITAERKTRDENQAKYEMLKKKYGYESESEDEGEEIDVVKVKNKKDGVDYLRGVDTGMIYELNGDQDVVGWWDKKTETITFYKDIPVKLEPEVLSAVD